MQPSPLSYFRTLSSLRKEISYPPAVIPHFPLPNSWQPLIYFLSLWICLFWMFLNGIMQYVAFCVWLLSPDMFSRFIHVVTCITLHSLLLLNNSPLSGYLSIHQLDIWVVSTFGLTVMNYAAMNILVQVFVWTYVFTSLEHI